MKLRDDLSGELLEHMTSDGVGIPTSARAPDSYTVNAVLQAFYLDLAVGERSTKTLEFYRQHFDQFLRKFPDLAHRPFTEIRLEHIQGYLLGKKIYAKSAAYRSFRALFYFAMRRGIVGQNLVKQIRPPKLPKDTSIPVVRPEELRALLRTCGPTFLGHRDRAIMTLLYDTGLRLSELTTMTFSRLDIEAMEIKVLGKGNKKRTVSFDESVRKALLGYIGAGRFKTDAFWLTEEMRPITNKGIQEMLRRRSDAARIHRVHPHMFRHACAVNLLKAGMDIDAVMKYLGQETLIVLQGYLKSLKSEDASEQHKRYSPMREVDA